MTDITLTPEVKPAKFTKVQAAEWLRAHPNRPNVRRIAEIWGWSPTTVWRFLKARGETAHETGDETGDETNCFSDETTLFRETAGGHRSHQDGPRPNAI